jgi:hypothetical protein
MASLYPFVPLHATFPHGGRYTWEQVDVDMWSTGNTDERWRSTITLALNGCDRAWRVDVVTFDANDEPTRIVDTWVQQWTNYAAASPEPDSYYTAVGMLGVAKAVAEAMIHAVLLERDGAR